MNSYAVYTYGGADALFETFNAIAALMGGDDYLTLIRLFGVLALFWVVIEMGVLQRAINWHWFIMFMLMFNIFFVPKVPVTIYDRLNPGATRVVANVPFGLAGPAWLFSIMGDGLTRLADGTFTPPGDLLYSNTGMVFGSKLVLAINNARFDDPLLNENLTMYAKQCVYYNIAYGFYSVRDVYQSQDLMNLLLSTTNNSNTRGMYYNDGAGNQTFMTCTQAALQLRTDIIPVVDGMIGRFANSLFASSGEPLAQRRAHLLSALPAAYGYMAGVATTAQQQLTQAAMANYFTNSYGQVAAMSGADAAAIAWSVAVSERQQRTAYRTMGEIASRALPLMQTVFQVIIYASFFMVFLALLLPVTVSGKALLTYIKALVWIEMWPVLYAMLNMVVSVYSRQMTTGVVDGSLGITSIAGLQGMTEVNSDIAIIAGYLALSIPLIAWGLVTAGGFAFSQLAQRMFMPSEQAAGQSAGEMARGNLSAGNMQAGNRSIMQQQTAPNMNLGAQYSDGTFSQSIGPNGRVASQLNNSDLGVGMATRESLMQNVSTSRGHAENVEQQHLQSVVEGQTAQSTAAQQLVETARQSEGSALRTEVSSVVGDVQSFHSSKDIAHTFGQEHGLNDAQATQVLANANASASASGGLELFGSGGKVSAAASVKGMSSSQLQDVYKSADIAKTSAAYSSAVTTEHRLAEVASNDTSAMHDTAAGRSLTDAHTSLSQNQDQWSAAHRKTEDLRSAEEFAASRSSDIQATANDYLEQFATSRGIDVHDSGQRGEIERLAGSQEFSEFVMHKAGMDVDIDGDGKIAGWQAEISTHAEQGPTHTASAPTGGAEAAQHAAGLNPSSMPDTPATDAVIVAGKARAGADASRVDAGRTQVDAGHADTRSSVEGQSTHVEARAFNHVGQNIKDQLPEAAGGLASAFGDGYTGHSDINGKFTPTAAVHASPGRLGGEEPGFTSKSLDDDAKTDAHKQGSDKGDK